MKKISLCLGFALLALVSCKNDKKTDKDTTQPTKEEVQAITTAPKKLTMKLEPKSESKVSGNVVFTEVEGVVKMTAIMDGLTEGTHAIHIHAKADCSSPDGKSTGGHWNPTMEPHGKWGDEKGYHKGDIGNFSADANGNGTITFETDQWCIGCGDETKDILGKAIIVHQGTDDFVSQPSGAAGARVSCGGIIE